MLCFRTLELLVDNEYAKLSDFTGCFQSESFCLTKPTYVYSYSAKIVEDSFFFLSCDYDNRKYSDTVYNLSSETEEKNPRKPDQIELRQQFFVGYSESRKLLYLSDLSKKGILRAILEERLGKNITIRECFSDINAFEKTGSFLKSISFVQRDSLISRTSDLFHPIYAPLGLDMPSRCYIKLDFGKGPHSLLKRVLPNLDLRRSKGEIEDVVVVGIDPNDIETVFNFESYVDKFSIDVSTDDMNRFVENDIIDALRKEFKKDVS